MTLYEFNLLTRDRQIEVTLNGKGTYLDGHIDASGRFNLYEIGLFFVEVEYDSVSNRIKGLKSFKEGALLNKYCYL